MLPAGEHDFNFSRLGYLPLTQTITVGSDSTTTIDIEMTLAPVGVLQGYAMTTLGEPMPGASISVLNTPFDVVTADESGYFEIALPVGTPWFGAG